MWSHELAPSVEVKAIWSMHVTFLRRRQVTEKSLKAKKKVLIP